MFVSGRDGDYEIYVMNANGSGVEQLTDNEYYDGFPAWSTDGGRIAFVSDRDNDYGLGTQGKRYECGWQRGCAAD